MMKFSLPSAGRAATLARSALPGIGFVLVCGALLWFFLLSPHGKSFPTLHEGTYVGEITGLVDGSPEPTGLYVEKLAGTTSLLLVIFEDGWTPQAVELKSTAQGSGFRPLAFSYKEKNYTLSGSGGGDSYSGELWTTLAARGKWNLRAIANADLKSGKVPLPGGFELNSWLSSKVKYNTAREELESLKATHEQQAAKHEKLTRFVQDENVLKDRSRSRIDELESEINRVAAERKKSTQDLKNALSDLSLLSKTTRRGQVIDLNRRIQRRENKWYGINWSSEAAAGDGDNIEAQLAEKEQVDLRKLNAEVKRAEEIRQLQVTITQEQNRIEQLRSLYEQKVRSVEPQAPPPIQERRPPVEEEEKKPWWKNFDAVLGFFAPQMALAADSPGFGIIEQTIAVPFRPVSVYALVSAPNGEMRQFHAVAVPMTPGATEVEVGQTVTVGAAVPVPADPESLTKKFFFTFFLVNLNGEFAATEVQSWSYKTLRSNNRDASELDQDRAQIEHDIPLQREENNKLEAKLTQVREQASKIAEVDDILDLKTELANLKDFDGKKSSDLDRLHALYREGQKVSDPAGVQDLRLKLLGQLRFAAQVTADADRLGMSRQDAAQSEYRRKLELVKSTSGEDPQQLAKQILQLRKQRREFESRLNLNGSGDAASGEF